MSKILLIEPDKMLRQAFGIALFPGHQIAHAMDAIPESLPRDFDVVMVDVAALRAKALWTERAVSIVDACAVPIIWIDEAKAEPPPRRKQFFPLSRPVSRDALRQALAQCLEEPDRPKPNATTSAKPSGAAQTRSTATSGESHIAGDARTYIDLVDIVEVSSKAEDAKALRQ